MLPLVREEIIQKNKWLKENDLYELLMIAELTPGPVAINIATFVGARIDGFWGALSATIAVILPSFIIIYGLTFFLERYQNLTLIHWAFLGIRAAIFVLISYAAYRLWKVNQKNWFFWIMMLLSFIMISFLKMNIFYVIFICACCGIGQQIIFRKE